MRALHPFRIWAYLGLAAALLAVPLTRYTDTTEVISLLLVGMFALMLAAYGEIFASVQRSTRILRAMHGQRDLLVMAGFRLGDLKLGIWRDLWHSGGWTALGALLAARFALGLALAQYSYLHHFRVSTFPLSEPINSAISGIYYISHNVLYGANPVAEVTLYQPVWWQRIAALLILAMILLAEAHLMRNLGLAVYLRGRHMRRWALPATAGARIGIVLFVLLVIQIVNTIFPLTGQGGVVFRPDLACMSSREMIGPYRSPYSPDLSGCIHDLMAHQGRRIIEASRLALMTPLDGGVLLAANAMRANLSVTHTGTGFDYEMEIVYTDVGSNRDIYSSYIYSYNWRDRVSPLLPILRMVAGSLLAVCLLLLTSWAIFRLVARRYGI